MNSQLIKALHDEAERKVLYEFGFHSHVEFKIQVNEKFTELIVLECARISDEVDDTMTNQGAASGEAFKEHFGVK